MSDIAGLFNVPNNDDERDVFFFTNQAHHRDVIRVIYQKLNIALPEFLLDPVNINDMGQWLDEHQQSHNEINAILGVSGFNLDDVDFKDKGTLTSWGSLHANEHYQWANITGIG